MMYFNFINLSLHIEIKIYIPKSSTFRYYEEILNSSATLNILHYDIVINYLIIYKKLKTTTSSDTYCTHYLIEKLDDENGNLHRQCLCAISKFKV